MLDPLDHEDWSAALDATVTLALARAGVRKPPVDAVAVARELGLEVALDRSQAGRARYVELAATAGSRRGSILVRPEPRRERTQWSVAHEIGERLAGNVFRRLGVDPREAGPLDRERLANAFAGRLLLPSVWFRADGRKWGWDLLALKARYPTASHELIARRMLENDDPVVLTVFDQGRLTWRRSNRGTSSPRLSPREEACWAAAHNRGEPALEIARGETIRAWPIHESDWRREIVRRELAEA